MPLFYCLRMTAFAGLLLMFGVLFSSLAQACPEGSDAPKENRTHGAPTKTEAPHHEGEHHAKEHGHENHQEDDHKNHEKEHGHGAAKQ